MNPKVIGFERLHSQLGDCTIAIKGLYALRKLYPKSKIIAFVSHTGHQLYKTLGIVDEFVVLDMEEARNGKFLESLQKYKLDVLLLLYRTSWTIKVAKQAKIPCVITELHAHNLFSLRFKSPRFKSTYRIHGSDKVLRLVREINKAHFDSNINNINFVGGGGRIKALFA